jgi:high-affinity Fe2+/Pb2+ permease
VGADSGAVWAFVIGFVIGFVNGLLLAWFYNKISGRQR